MKPHSSIQIVRKCPGMHTDPVLSCLDELEELNNGHLLGGRDPRVCELANSLRLGTAMLSQDLSGA
jgi:hypothetical protein